MKPGKKEEVSQKVQMAFMRNPQASVDDIVLAVGVSPDKARRLIADLVTEGVLVPNIRVVSPSMSYRSLMLLLPHTAQVRRRGMNAILIDLMALVRRINEGRQDVEEETPLEGVFIEGVWSSLGNVPDGHNGHVDGLTIMVRSTDLNILSVLGGVMNREIGFATIGHTLLFPVNAETSLAL